MYFLSFIIKENGSINALAGTAEAEAEALLDEWEREEVMEGGELCTCRIE